MKVTMERARGESSLRNHAVISEMKYDPGPVAIAKIIVFFNAIMNSSSVRNSCM